MVFEDYLNWDGVAEGQALRWSQLFDIEISKTPVRDKIYYWGDRGFFDYSINPKYKMYISKNPNTNIWIEENGKKVEKDLNSNLKFYFYNFSEQQNIKINVDGVTKEYQLNENKIIDFGLDSLNVQTITLVDNDGEYNYSTVYKEINRNLIYLGN